jgi:hypothetical protein
MRPCRLLVAVVACVFAGCSAEGGDSVGGAGASNGGLPRGSRDGGPGSSSYFPDALAPAKGSGATGTGPTATSNCGLQMYGLQRLPADLLLVQDRSGSMTMGAGPGSAQSRWQAVTSALDAVVGKTQASVNWGLKLYPNPGSACGVQNGVELAPTTNAHDQIVGLFMSRAAASRGGTPTRAAVEAATAFLKASTSPNPKYLLLATDGLPNCLNGDGSDRGHDEDGAVKAVADAEAAGFATFVVGIAIDATSTMTLNRLADAGSKPRNDPTMHFYPATSQDELTSALAAIAGQVGSCVFPLDKQPPSPQDVAVDVNGKRIGPDPANGWTYGAGMRSIELHGKACEAAKIDDAKTQIIYGCPGTPIP